MKIRLDFVSFEASAFSELSTEAKIRIADLAISKCLGEQGIAGIL
jgi:hypothetical protein